MQTSNLEPRTSNTLVTPHASRLTRHGHWVILALLLWGCSTGPSPIVVYQDDRAQITLAMDPSAGSGHQHPYTMSAEQMAQILSGVWVKDRNAITGFGLFKGAKGTPAFQGTLVPRLAEPLARALGRASPQDLVTFYVTQLDRSRGPVVTSGGVFVRNDRLYVMLANAHTMPSETSNDFSTAIELDNRDAPLEPIGRFHFTVGFSPAEAWIPYAEAKRQTGYEPYMDASKLLVIDLSRLAKPPAP
jgi:hypothetical protein